jgi:hypothetical protein
MSNHQLYSAGFGIKRPLSTSWLTAFPCRSLMARFGASQASVTLASMICRCTLAQCGQVKVRKSRPISLGSMAESFIGDPQAVH